MLHRILTHVIERTFQLNFDVFLTVHLSIILVINHLDAQSLLSTCALDGHLQV